MRATPLEHRIDTIIRPAVQDMGFDVVCVKIIGEGGGRNVQIMAERLETRSLGLEDCAALSRTISALLDVEDVIEGAYRLEVSSPGIDRPLLRLSDFKNYEGFEARLETAMPNDEGQKKFKGRLRGLKDETVLIETERGVSEIAFADLVKAKLVLSDELIKATAKPKPDSNEHTTTH